MRQGQRRLGVVGMQERAALVDGTVEIESTPGAGTTVFVRLPIPQMYDERGARMPLPVPGGLFMKKLRVFLADDHAVFRQGLDHVN